MRTWWRTTLEYMGEYIMKHGWIDPMGVMAPVWFGQPEEPASTAAFDDVDHAGEHLDDVA